MRWYFSSTYYEIRCTLPTIVASRFQKLSRFTIQKVGTKIVVDDSGSQLLRTEAAQHQLSRCLRLRLLLMPAPLSLPCLLQGTTYKNSHCTIQKKVVLFALFRSPFAWP